MQAKAFPYKWWALIGLGLLSFTSFLDFTIVTTALPFIQKDLQATVLQLQWVMTIFAMVLCMFMIIVGKLGDLLGHKKVFYFGFILFGIAAMGSASSQTIQWLIFFRGIQGFAAAIIATIAVALLPQAFPATEQMRAIGIFSAFNRAGLASGPFLGGVLISLLSWRWVFWINIPIIIIGLLCCSFSLKSSPKLTEKVKLDWYGLILLVVGLGCFVYGIIYGEQAGWDLALTWILIVVGAGALLLLIVVENKVAQPLLDLSLFKNTHIRLAMFVCVAAGFAAYIFMFFDSLYLALMRGQTAFVVGLTLVCVPVIQVIISLRLEKLVEKFNVVNLLKFGVITAFLSALCHAFFSPNISILFVLLALILMGYTWGIANAGTIAAIKHVVPPEKMGSAAGTIFTFWNVSGSVFLALSTVLFHWRENIAMNSALTNGNVSLTAQQSHQIHLLLADPEQAQTVLSQFVGEKANEILQSFHAGFMSGFHWVAWFAAVVIFIILLLIRKVR